MKVQEKMIRKKQVATLLGLLTMCSLALAIDVNDPIAYWKFDEGNGTTAYDSAGSHNGSITGATWTTEGRINSALHFDASGDYVSIGVLELGNQWTFAAWVKSDVDIGFFSPRRDNILLTSNKCQIYLGTNIFGHVGSLRFVLSKCGTLYSNKNFWDANEWYYITCTWNGLTQAIYVNGVLDNYQNPMCLGGSGWWFATYVGGEWTEPSISFDGVIDDVRIYDKALSAGEVWQIYGEGFGGRAFNPNPYDGAVDETTDKILTWSPGKDADLHSVYLGTDYNDVNNADTSSPEYMGSFDVNSFDPGGLEYGTTYYWRIDEVNESNLWKGDVWSFSTMKEVLHVPSEYPTIQAAIEASFNGNTVVVAPGTYAGPGNRDIDFLGKAITVRSIDPNDPYIVAATIIDCQGTYSDPHRGFKFHRGEGPESVLAGVTIINGVAPKDGSLLMECSGGAILCEDSSPTITKCSISGNEADEAGGGIYCENSSPTITNCTITGNIAEGGGIYCWESNANITNCTISNNNGRGIGCCYDSSPTVTDCAITDNTAEYGGGICGGWGSITNCIIAGNLVEEDGGGLAYCYGPITNCIISGNIAEDGGGLAWCYSPVTNCVISGNTAEDDGGGFYICWGPIINCIISDNKAAYAGGLYGCDGPITNCTITGNRAEGKYGSGHGGGLVGGGETTNCIIWDNWPDQIYGSPIVTYSNVQGGYEGEGNIDADPRFALDTDYHIMPSSPCIDAGTNDPCGGLAATDIEGIARPLNGDGDGNAVADMGAFEYNPHAPSIAVSAVDFYFTQDWPKPDPQTLLIRNAGGEPLHWEITEDCNWLQISPANGVSTSQIEEVILTVDPNDLVPGLYNYDFDVQDPNASNNPVTVRVTMPVGEILCVPSQDFDTIQEAIDAADNYDIVLVADGNYTGEGNRNLDFRGKPITVCSENGPNNCIIDCQNSGGGFYFQSGEKENSIVNGFTITNAKKYYCGICCKDSSPTIKNCTIRDNMDFGILCKGPSYPAIANCTISDNGGCGISYCSRCYEGMLSATIINCTVSNNSGGGISTGCCRGTLTITDSTITNNSSNGDDGYGGGIASSFCCLTIKNSIITDNSTEGYGGGGIYCDYGDLTITNSTISDNSARRGGGGGIFCWGKSLEIIACNISGNSARCCGGIDCIESTNANIINCTITGNSVEMFGGGLAGCNGPITNCTITANTAGEYGGGLAGCDGPITNCTISGNKARKGGGIYCWLSPTITNCTVTGNTAVEYGGGIFCYHSDATITDCNISGNSVTDDPGYGGGVYCYKGNPTISKCTIMGNTTGFGGGVYCKDSSPIISYCTITGNSAEYDGGGIFGCNGPITNCTISGNSASGRGGGGLAACHGPITNCTITGNSAERNGGGFLVYGGPITNCIIWNNAAIDGPQLYLSTEPTYSCIQDWTSGGLGNIAANPCFIEPGYWDTNGLWLDGDYYLLPDSPCIDAGDPNYIPEPNETDLDGNPRIIGGRIDMGAYEANYIEAAMKFTPQTLNCNSKGNWVKAHLTLPEGFLPQDVDVDTPAWTEPMDTESEYIKVLSAGNGPVKLVVAFDRQAFCDSITEAGQVEVTVIGSLTTGQYFYGSDTIKIISRR